jgi:23S rRNA (guanosine2251-2'-O)-methyltransferase
MRKLQMDELGRMSPEEFRNAQKTPIVVVLDNVRSALNVGSVFRSCDAFAVEGLILCGITAVPPNKEINKSALGSTETVNWMHYESTKEAVIALKERGYKIYGVEQTDNAIPLPHMDLIRDKAPKALVLGNEVNGVSYDVLELCDACIEIPQLGTKHSLNVAVAAGIVIWEFAVGGKIG